MDVYETLGRCTLWYKEPHHCCSLFSGERGYLFPLVVFLDCLRKRAFGVNWYGFSKGLDVLLRLHFMQPMVYKQWKRLKWPGLIEATDPISDLTSFITWKHLDCMDCCWPDVALLKFARWRRCRGLNFLFAFSFYFRIHFWGISQFIGRGSNLCWLLILTRSSRHLWSLSIGLDGIYFRSPCLSSIACLSVCPASDLEN